jgi:hypothetical protein
VIAHLKCIFARHSIPKELIADNMPFNSKQMREFADDWTFTITTTSPNYPQSNGQSERAIQTIKKLLKKAADDKSDPYIGLLQYRNAPIAGLNVSPAQLLFSRRLRTKLPVSSASLEPDVCSSHQALCDRQARQKKFYDARARPLPSLQPGDVVRVQHEGEWQRGMVTAKHATPRSYIVETEHGSSLRRNRRHLIKTCEDPPLCLPPVEDDGLGVQTAAPSTKTPSHSPPSAQRELTGSTSAKPSSSASSTSRGTLKSSNTPLTTRSGRVIKPPVRFKDFV